MCEAHHIPCTAHLEILDARDLLLAALHGIEHITSIGPSLLPRLEREAYRQAVLADNDARRDGRYEMFARLQLDGADARSLWFPTMGGMPSFQSTTWATSCRRSRSTTRRPLCD